MTTDVAGSSRDERLPAELERLLGASFAPHEPGAVIGVYRDGVLVADSAVGLASLEYALPITSDTVFDIASSSKQFTAACALLLERDGDLDLDADVRTWVPELPIGAITLRSCLQHTAGLRDYLDVSSLAGLTLGEVVDDTDFLVALARTSGLNFDPGRDIAYSNTGFVLAAVSIARSGGRPFSDVLRERVFEPLGMTSTRLHDEVGAVVPGMAFSYSPRPAGGFLREEMPEAQVGDGAVLTTVRDLAGWHGFLLDGRVLGEDLRARLVSPSVVGDGRTTGYGMGVFVFPVDGVPVIQHTGVMYGYRSHLLAAPSLGVGITVLSNRGDANAYRLARRAFGVVRGAPQRPSSAATGGTLAATSRLDGSWFEPESGHLLSLSPGAEGGVLVGRGGSAERFRSVSQTHAQNEDGDLDLTLEDGIVMLRGQMGTVHRYLPTSREVATSQEALVGSYRISDIPGDVVVSRLDSALRLAIGRQHPVPLDYLASYEDLDIYGTETVTVSCRRGGEPVDSVSLAVPGTWFPRVSRVTPSVH